MRRGGEQEAAAVEHGADVAGIERDADELDSRGRGRSKATVAVLMASGRSGSSSSSSRSQSSQSAAGEQSSRLSTVERRLRQQ